MMSFVRNNIPNFLTCLNLTCGILGLFLLSTHGLDAIDSIKWLILAAGVFDFFDGFVARLLKSASNVGKDLDSLADATTFGMLPCLVCFQFMNSIESQNQNATILPYIALLIGIFSVIRLAIFNNDTRQSDHFIGVPTPANAFFLIFLVSNLVHNDLFFSLNSLQFSILIGISCFLLVSPLPLLALKFKTFSFRGNEARFALIILSLAAIVFFGKIAVPIIFLIYLSISILLKLLPTNEIQSHR